MGFDKGLTTNYPRIDNLRQNGVPLDIPWELSGIQIPPDGRHVPPSHSTSPVFTFVAIPASLRRIRSGNRFFSSNWALAPPIRSCTYHRLRDRFHIDLFGAFSKSYLSSISIDRRFSFRPWALLPLPGSVDVIPSICTLPLEILVPPSSIRCSQLPPLSVFEE